MLKRFVPTLIAVLLLVSAGGLPAADTETSTDTEMPTDAEMPAETVLMSSDWAVGMCDAWNQDPALTEGLAKWMENDKDRGYKILRIYRMDCTESPQIQLRLSDRDGAVTCVEGGLATDEELDSSCDYVMFAKTDRWLEMGAGEYGPMGGMMTGRLKFQGPKWEAMKNMGPFKSFLQLVGKVPGDVAACPTLPVEEPMDTEEPMAELPEATDVGR